VQFGFRPNLSTEVALIHFTDSILDNMDKGAVTGAVFLVLEQSFWYLFAFVACQSLF
jgi:hypothetical protein